MSQPDSPAPSDRDATPRSVRLRLLVSVAALTAGVIAFVITLLLVHSTLG